MALRVASSLSGGTGLAGRAFALARSPIGRRSPWEDRDGRAFLVFQVLRRCSPQTPFVDGYLDRVEMSTLGLPLRATSSRRPGLLPLAGRVAARTQREVNAPLNVSCLIPFYKGQECGVYPRTGKGMQ